MSQREGNKPFLLSKLCKKALVCICLRVCVCQCEMVNLMTVIMLYKPVCPNIFIVCTSIITMTHFSVSGYISYKLRIKVHIITGT